MGRAVIVFLVLVLGLAACDPTSVPFTSVLQVASANDQLYAYAVESRSWGPGCCGYGEAVFYASQDGGTSWQETATPPIQLQQRIAAASERIDQACDHEFPNLCTRVDGIGRAWRSTDGGETWYDTPTYYLFEDIDDELAYKSLDYRAVCSPKNPLSCFRLTRLGQIENSIDGGASWKIDWQIPEGRREYIERSYARYRPGIPEGIRPLDLAVLDTDEGILVAAAMGNQGVILRTQQGLWERVAVGSASPLADKARNLAEAASIATPEAGRSAWYALLFAIGLSLVGNFGKRILLQRAGKARTNSRRLHLTPLVLVYTLAFFMALILPTMLWAMGSIASLGSAAVLSTGLGILVGALGLAHTIWSVIKFSRQTIKESDLTMS